MSPYWRFTDPAEAELKVGSNFIFVFCVSSIVRKDILLEKKIKIFLTFFPWPLFDPKFNIQVPKS